MPSHHVEGKPEQAVHSRPDKRPTVHPLEPDLREILDLATEIGPAVRRGEGGFAAIAARQIAATAGGALCLVGAEPESGR